MPGIVIVFLLGNSSFGTNGISTDAIFRAKNRSIYSFVLCYLLADNDQYRRINLFIRTKEQSRVTTYDCCDLRRLIIFCIDLLFLRTYKYTYLLFARLVVLLPFYRGAFTFKRLALSGESAKLGDPFKAFHFLADELSNSLER